MVDVLTVQAGRPRPVCVVTTQGDLTADRVILHLADREVPVIRFDLADFPDRLRLNAVFDGARWAGTLGALGHAVELTEIGSVFWWHPEPVRAAHTLPAAAAEWVSRESTAGLAGVLASLDCLHVNHPAATSAAQNKPDTLATAARCGLSVPPTWVGNTPAEARGFEAAAPDGVVCKSLVSPHVDHGDGHHTILYTRPLTADQLGPSLALMAHQLQHTIRKETEVRLIAVGEHLFAGRISGAKGDFRANYGSLTYDHIDVPDPVRAGVHALLDHYDLVYAALDLLIDAEGRWWFVDLNPAGMYGWIEQHLDLSISGALADLLQRPALSARPRHQPAASPQTAPHPRK
ncbi:MvdC/MvdD family ATP grasp protein [Streptomyces sp. NPDC057654]|uniref:MvdC/MvdD family ATP grasp protein n=1 Tax=Streptomyces sp. NPDC057654 TaxID=3346196 RepID=UPI00368EF295